MQPMEVVIAWILSLIFFAALFLLVYALLLKRAEDKILKNVEKQRKCYEKEKAEYTKSLKRKKF
ncbi:MAG: hypothetical protein NC253_00930 [Ruminococcus sp.]|nr:hypothetical protein [Ruminococcus sp.]MCM1382009.1 hypothetical protein [Muribaculaceae bacterium]MCM1478983.1 hypothetical protein [Muribaculaceae bacterium]